MDLIGLFSSICIGVGILAYFEGRRIGKKQGLAIGRKVGFLEGLINESKSNDIVIFYKDGEIVNAKRNLH